MYRRAAYPIANMLADIPFSATRVFIYNVVIYFMTHLDRSAGGFWTYHLIVYLTFLSMQAFFRAFGLIFYDFNTAFRISVIFFLHILQYAGVWVPLAAMKRWLFWIVSCSTGIESDVLMVFVSLPQYYINPLAYGTLYNGSFGLSSALSMFFSRMGRSHGQRVHAHHVDVRR